MKKVILIVTTVLSSVAFAQKSSLSLVCLTADTKSVYSILIEPEQTVGVGDIGSTAFKKITFMALVQDASQPNSRPALVRTIKKEFSFKKTGAETFTFTSKKLKLHLFCEIERINGHVGIFTGSN